MPDTKYILVLSGGGFKGAFQVGALEYIFEHGLKKTDGSRVVPAFEVVTGVSVGALNGALVAAGKFEELKRIWFEELKDQGSDIIFTSHYIDPKGNINYDNIFNDLLPRLNLRTIWKLLSKKGRRKLIDEVLSNVNSIQALADNTPLYEKLMSILSKSDFQNVVYRCGLVKFDDGAYVSVGPEDCPTDSDFIKAIQASTTMPVVWEPVNDIAYQNARIDHAIDGGLRNSTPLSDAIEMINQDTLDYQYHFVIITNKPESLGRVEGPHSIVKIAQRSLLDISFDEIAFNDINQFKLINSLVKQAHAVDPSIELRDPQGLVLKKFDCHIITPIGEELGDTLDTSFEMIERRRHIGKTRAKEVIEGLHGNPEILV